MGAGRVAEIAAAPDRGRSCARHAGCRGAMGHAPAAADDAQHPRDDRRGSRRGALARSSSGRRGARSRVVRAPAAVRPHASSITRAREQASGLRARLDAARRRSDRASRDRGEAGRVRAARLAGYAWLVFTSANGVDAFFDRGLARARARRAGARRGCGSPRSGPERRRRSKRFGVRADLVPERFVAESLVEAFPGAERRRATGAARPRPSRRATCCPTG